MDLSDKQWKYVLKGNSLLSAFVMDDDKSITRAKRPAFILADDQLDEPGIPDFELFDDSSIVVAELKSQLQSVALNSCFDWEDIDRSLKSSIGCLALRKNRSITASHVSSKEDLNQETRDDLWVAYNFPRVNIFLRSEHLAVTPACDRALKQLQETPKLSSLQDFFETFGYIYATTVQLGGRLQCIKSVASVSGSTLNEKRENIKRAASTTFSVTGVAKAERGTERSGGSQGATGNAFEKETTGLSWEARGGDTLLSSDPAQWAPSVKNFESWRVIKRSSTETIDVLLGQMPEWKHIPDLMLSIITSHTLHLQQVESKEEAERKKRSVRCMTLSASERKEAEQWLYDMGLSVAGYPPGIHYEGSYNFDKTLAFHTAIAHGHPLALLRVLEEKVDVESLYKNAEVKQKYDFYEKCDGWTPLKVAVTNRDLEITSILLQAGAKVEKRSHERDEPFIVSIILAKRQPRDAAMMHLLLDHGANINSTRPRTEHEKKYWRSSFEPMTRLHRRLSTNVGGCSRTALAVAILEYDIPMARLLLTRGADVKLAKNLEGIEAHNIVGNGLQTQGLYDAESTVESRLMKQMLVQEFGVKVDSSWANRRVEYTRAYRHGVRRNPEADG